VTKLCKIKHRLKVQKMHTYILCLLFLFAHSDPSYKKHKYCHNLPVGQAERCARSSTYRTFVHTPKAILHPSWNTRFPITHFIKLRSNPPIVLATQCPCLRFVHIQPIPSITSYLGLLSPSLIPSDVDVNPYCIFRHDRLGRKKRHYCVQCQLL